MGYPKLIFCLFAGFLAVESVAQSIELPDNPLKGRIVFENQGCTQCHSIQGYGGIGGPDLSKYLFYGSFFQLAAAIWNHAPSMDRKYRKVGINRPQLSEQEYLELTSFIYYLRYLGEPGSVSRGERLLSQQQCSTCHDSGRLGAPPFESSSVASSPLELVQAMWNHGPEMQEASQDAGIAFPKLGDQDIVDIAAYLQAVSRTSEPRRMSPGSPAAGRIVFREKHCQDCHSNTAGSASEGPDLSDMNLRKSVTEIAGAMWNHSPVMLDHMKQSGIEWPRFEGMEMADLISYLYFTGFQIKPGNADDGEFVFEYNGCAYCHRTDGSGVGPSPDQFSPIRGPVSLARLMWNHAPQMEDELLIQNEEWPQMTEREMEDLYAFLHSINSNE